jgi:hypothetical protein
VLDQEREIGAAPIHGFEETEQAIEHRLRIRAAFRCCGSRREELRHERVDALPRQRRQLDVARTRANAHQIR